MCGGSTHVEAPQPSAEEKALQSEQLKLLQAQQAETEMLKPFVLQGMGLTYDDNGELRQMTEPERLASMSPLEQSQYALAKQQQDRLAKAYAGELDVSPALEEKLTDEKAKMTEALSQRLGPNWMMSTPGQQAMSAFDEKANLLREEARRGMMTSGEGLLMSSLGYLGNTDAQKTTEAAQFPGRTTGLFQGYGQAQQPYQYYSGLQNQVNIANAQADAQNQAGLMGGIGSLFGAGANAYGTYAGLAALT